MKKYLLIVAILIASCDNHVSSLKIEKIENAYNGCKYYFNVNQMKGGDNCYFIDTCGKYKIGDVLK